MGILQRINLERRLSLMVSQHMLDTALTYGTRIVGLRQGRVVFDGPPGAMTPDVVADIYEGGMR
jgi:phosphonate transport system ATP-binding protein